MSDLFTILQTEIDKHKYFHRRSLHEQQCECGEVLTYNRETLHDWASNHVAEKVQQHVRGMLRQAWDQGFDAGISRPLYGFAERNPY